ncbi:MAG: triose-phosphate isomerase [Alphaproteobacteria bacterium]|nr:triose-phosphate isomerase [Alphaproteobacteria bacterium]
MRKLIAGNWKMNGSHAQAVALLTSLSQKIADENLGEKTDICVCPPFPYLSLTAEKLETLKAAQSIALGAQDCSAWGQQGAFTGDVSAAMLSDIGCRYVILGHSERRGYYNESSLGVAEKIRLAHEAGLIAILCVGETQAERDACVQDSTVVAQLRESIPPCASSENLVIAYEPVWAIGTGKTAKPADVEAMHALIRRFLQEKLDKCAGSRILYGGSVKAENARELFAIANVDGALVGGASLKEDQFLDIIRAAL